MRKLLVMPVIATAPGLAGPAFVGQPSASCEAAGANPPPGFSTAGFANAETHYAASDGTPSAAQGSANAASQYDMDRSNQRLPAGRVSRQANGEVR
jgi:hypothetical protein